ncbi:MAG: hypothetical protein WCZ23_12925, partial [Rhodospirillaceae bacterium]
MSMCTVSGWDQQPVSPQTLTNVLMRLIVLYLPAFDNARFGRDAGAITPRFSGVHTPHNGARPATPEQGRAGRDAATRQNSAARAVETVRA